jgi:large subunit ribosomal protein L33
LGLRRCSVQYDLLQAAAGKSSRESYATELSHRPAGPRFLDIQGPPTRLAASNEDLDMAKATTIKVKLVSSADTGFYYVTRKNSRTMTDKLVMKKYDPVAKKHVEFRESKIK